MLNRFISGKTGVSTYTPTEWFIPGPNVIVFYESMTYVILFLGYSKNIV